MKPVILKQSFWANRDISWEKEFDKEFTRDDGLIDKYSWYGVVDEPHPQSTPEAIKQFIQNLLDKQKADILSIVQKEIAKSDKYQINSLEKIRMSIVELNK